MVKKLVLRMIDWYQHRISPRKPPCCKYLPTCSSYSKEAIERFGIIKGGLLSIWRILRCNPFSKGGYDPVPKSKEDR